MAPGAQVVGEETIEEYVDEYQYSAPEALPEYHATSGTLPVMRKEGDVYGMGMVAYKASLHRQLSPGPRIKSHVGTQVLTGNKPRSGWNALNTLSRMVAGEIPERPSSGMIPDPVWKLLEECWSRNPAKRPSTAQVFKGFSNLRTLTPPRAGSVPGSRTIIRRTGGHV